MTRDVVIVGGGIAGLSAAWRLRHRDVLLLEAGDRLGGRMRSDACGDVLAQLRRPPLPRAGLARRRDGRDCGLETVPVTGGMMGLAVGATAADRGPRRDVSAPAAAVRPRPHRVRQGGAQGPARRGALPRRVHDFEDDRTFGEFLGPLPPAVRDIFSCAAHRATAELDELSAGCGIGLFALVWGGKGSLIARNLLGGTRAAAGGARPRARRARDELPRATRSAPTAPTSSSRTTAARRSARPRDRRGAGAARRAAGRHGRRRQPPPRSAS